MHLVNITSTDPWASRKFLYEAIHFQNPISHPIIHGMDNPLLESFAESPKACVTNFSHPLAKLKGKKTQICHQFVKTTALLELEGNLLYQNLDELENEPSRI